MEKPERYLSKSELIAGAYYTGICRNSGVAMWMGKEQKFIYIRYKFGFMLDEIEHFEDVKESNTDGFVPIQMIYNPDDDWSWEYEFRNQIGY
jgi:hypothetical protein